MRTPIWRAAQAFRASLTPRPSEETSNTDARLYAANFRNLLFSAAWFGPADGGLFNYLPVFLARLGATSSVISLLAAGPSLVGVIFLIPGGAYTDTSAS